MVGNSSARPLRCLSLCLTLQDIHRTPQPPQLPLQMRNNCVVQVHYSVACITVKPCHGIQACQQAAIVFGSCFADRREEQENKEGAKGCGGFEWRVHTWVTSTRHLTVPNLMVSPLLIEYRSPPWSLTTLLPRSRNVCNTSARWSGFLRVYKVAGLL